MKIKTDRIDKIITVDCDNMYEYRLMLDRIKRAKPIIEECKNNPKNKGQ